MHDTIGQRGICGLWIFGRPYNLGGLLADGLPHPKFLEDQVPLLQPLYFLQDPSFSSWGWILLHLPVHWVLQKALNLLLVLRSIHQDRGIHFVCWEDHDVSMSPKCLHGCTHPCQGSREGAWLFLVHHRLPPQITSRLCVAHPVSYALHCGHNICVRSCTWSRIEVQSSAENPLPGVCQCTREVDDPLFQVNVALLPASGTLPKTTELLHMALLGVVQKCEDWCRDDLSQHQEAPCREVQSYKILVIANY